MFRWKGQEKCIFETPHNKIKSALNIEESNFNEKLDQNFNICLWSGPRGLTPARPYGQPDRKKTVFCLTTPLIIIINYILYIIIWCLLEHCLFYCSSWKIIFSYKMGEATWRDYISIIILGPWFRTCHFESRNCAVKDLNTLSGKLLILRGKCHI